MPHNPNTVPGNLLIVLVYIYNDSVIRMFHITNTFLSVQNCSDKEAWLYTNQWFEKYTVVTLCRMPDLKWIYNVHTK